MTRESFSLKRSGYAERVLFTFFSEETLKDLSGVLKKVSSGEG